MTPALAPLGSKIGKCLRLLASDNDSEVVASARALQRVLISAKLDLCDLANVIEFLIRHDARRAAATAHNRASGRQKPTPAYHAASAMILRCHACPELLTSKELDFVRSLYVRGRGELSARQFQWLSDIYAR